MFTLIKVLWFQFHYGLVSSAKVSPGLVGGSIGEASIRGAEWRYSMTVSGVFGRTDAEARLHALRFWVRKHIQQKTLILDDVGYSTLEFVNTSKVDAKHTFLFGQTRHGMGQEPADKHRAITVIDAKNAGNAECNEIWP